jgi:hypothetical protein
MTLEHLAPENPAGKGGLTPEQVASIGNLILLDQELNNQLANKSFPEKVAILQNSHVWVDPAIVSAAQWAAPEVERRTRALAKDAYDNVWAL